MNKLISVCILICCITGCTGGGGSSSSAKRNPDKKSSARAPEWVQKGETGKHKKTMFWLSVGSGETPELASQSARQEVAAQIRTHVRSRMTDISKMDNGDVNERFESISQNITDAKLEGLEIIEQFTGRRRSYALAGLNKSVYLGKIEDKVTELYKKAESSSAQAMGKKQDGVFPLYYSLLHTALLHIDELKNPEYTYRSFVRGGTAAGNRGLELERKVEKELNEFISGIKISAQGGNQKGDPGKPLSKPLTALFTLGGKPLADFPVIFKTVKGRATFDASSKTDAKGAAVCRISRVEKSPVKTIRVRCTLDLGTITAMKKKYTEKAAEFDIQMDEVSKWLVFIAESGSEGVILSSIVSGMKDAGVEVHKIGFKGAFDEEAFVNEALKKYKAYNLITGVFRAEEIDKALGTSTCRAAGHIKAVELATGRVLFHKNISNIIGVSYTGNRKEGCKNSLQKAGKQAAVITKTELGY